jgi:hypothetical protein
VHGVADVDDVLVCAADFAVVGEVVVDDHVEVGVAVLVGDAAPADAVVILVVL